VADESWPSFPTILTEAQRVPDNLAELGRLTQEPDTNIIKLPNISASVQPAHGRHQGTAGKGYKVPDFPEDPKTDETSHPAATPNAWAAPSTRCCAKATPTAARPPRSRSTRERTRTDGEVVQASRTACRAHAAAATSTTAKSR
jgi:hypothetical protein